MVRGGYRLIPWWARRAVYKPMVAHYTDHPDTDADPAEGDPAAQPAPPMQVGQ